MARILLRKFDRWLKCKVVI